MRNWVLPEYIEDVLPDEAERTEALRRLLLDHFRAGLSADPAAAHRASDSRSRHGAILELQTFGGRPAVGRRFWRAPT
jgi:hypothetical protein